MSIITELESIRKEIPPHVTLVAVSKTRPNEEIMKAYDFGQRHFGENRVQELVSKAEALPVDIKWHAVGHLQRNKVKYIAPFIHLIHSVDSLKLLKEINKQALKNQRKIDVLLQFHIAQEDTKFGLNLDEAKVILDSSVYREVQNVNIAGVMGMATNTDDVGQIESEFKQLKSIFDKLKEEYFQKEDMFKEVSMGMSNDYALAIKNGSSLIRVGSKIFK